MMHRAVAEVSLIRLAKALTLVVLVLGVLPSNGYQVFQSKIPNAGNQNLGEKSLVPDPGGVADRYCESVGHLKQCHGPPSDHGNPFGVEFIIAASEFTKQLCQADSDEDGYTNGYELGDPTCVWKPGETPARTKGLSHPGFACSTPGDPFCLANAPSVAALPGTTAPPPQHVAATIHITFPVLPSTLQRPGVATDTPIHSSTTVTNACLSNPCANGMCIQDAARYACICPAGFVGTTCSTRQAGLSGNSTPTANSSSSTSGAGATPIVLIASADHGCSALVLLLAVAAAATAMGAAS